MVAHCIYIMGKEFGDTLIFSDFDSALLLKWGSDWGPLTLTGQFWRVITSTFLHFNFLHLAFNMLFLWGFGRYLDRLFTRTQILAIYLLTGVAASIFSLGWHPLAISGGASGAIYGQVGVLIALLCFARSNFSRRDIRNLLLWIFFSMPIGLLWGHVSKHTDYAAHAGGILSGFVIGVLLARAFRLSPAERAARQRKIWQFAAVALVIIFAVVAQVRRSKALEYLGYLNTSRITSTETTTYSNHPPEVARIFLDLKGDPKLVRHFSGLLHAELENKGITVTSSAPEADAVVHGEIHAQSEHTNLNMGVVQMYINSQNGLQEINFCAAVSESETTDLYSQSAAAAASQLRTKYPDARTARLDPKSDMAASSQFAGELPSALKASSFTVVQSGSADITLHITLLTQKVSTEKDVAAYDVKVVTKNGEQFFASSGEETLFAKLAGDAPVACPERLTNLKWLYNNATLYSVASEIADNLYNPQNAPRVKKPVKPE